MRDVTMKRVGLLAGAMASVAMAGPADARETPRFYTRPGSVAPFSPVVRAGNLLFVSGQIGMSADGKVPSTMAEQARLAMDNVRGALKLAGASLDDVVKCTVMLTDMTQWAEFNRVYVGYFRPGHLPARSAAGVTALALGAHVEVECIAFK